MTTLDELQGRISDIESDIAETKARLAAIPAQQKSLRAQLDGLREERASAIAEMRKALPAGIVRTRKARAATTT